MRYVTAVPVLVLLFIIDLFILLLCPIIVGFVIIEERPEFPFAWSFVKRLWLA